MASRRYKVKKTAPVANKDAGSDLIESSEAIAEQLSRTEEFVQKNRNLVLGILAAIILIVAGILGYRYYVQDLDSTAQQDLFPNQFYHEKDSTNKVINGDGINLSMQDIIEDYGSTKSANLAHFYLGVSYLKNGQYQQCIDHMKEFSASDILVQARAYSVIGDAYMELGNFNDAADYYDQAANYKANKFTSPQYLFKAALAYEKQNNLQAAIDRYQQVIDKYYGSSEYQDARKYKARLEALASP